MTKAFSSFDLAGKLLQNRIVMAPMTRSRAGNPGALATDLMATYYAQRASAGLIITEGTQPSIVGQGYPSTPGLHSTEQVESWKKVTSAVHAKGGVIFAQLMHTGRIGHKDLLPEGLVPLAPSAVIAEGEVYTSKGPQAFETPKEMTEAEILQTINDFATAAENAIAAGFDGGSPPSNRSTSPMSKRVLDETPLAAVPLMDTRVAHAFMVVAADLHRLQHAVKTGLLDAVLVQIEVLDAPAHFFAPERLLAVLALGRAD